MMLSSESTQPISIHWPDTTQSILGDEFLSRDEMMMNNVVEADRFANENSMDLLLHPSLFSDLDPNPRITSTLDEPALVPSPESSSKTTQKIYKTPTKTSIGNSCRRRKKPRGMPKRPLSAYNIFFQTQRTIVQAEAMKDTKVGSKGLGFEGLGKLIGKRWKEAGKEEKKKYQMLAERDGARYRKEMDVYNRRNKELLEKERIRQQQRTSAIGINAICTTESRMGGVSSFDPRHRACDSRKNSHPLDFLGKKSAAESEAEGSHEDRLSLPIVPPPVDHAGKCLFPPGMEIVLSDSGGRDRVYRVEYKYYKMSRAEASRFMESITGGTSRQCKEPHRGISHAFIELPNSECAPI